MPDPAILAEVLREWFRRSARDLPWRGRPAGSRDVYPVLVSEIMLQQTQVSRVLEAFLRFMTRFPTLDTLAGASENEVLAAWTGLGYYRRARLLHASARALVDRHGGALPSDPKQIAALPGVGAYTAGALASLCHDLPVSAIDGNVLRVLLRLHARSDDPKHPRTLRWARDRAHEMLVGRDDRGVESAGEGSGRSDARAGSGLLNEALIELGALICTPRTPDCAGCPLRPHCRAHAMGQSQAIPAPRAAKARSLIHCAVVLVRDSRGRVLIEQRPSSGLWGGLWQAPTLDRLDAPPTPRAIRAWLPVERLREVDRFEFLTTHRLLRFICYEAGCRPGARLGIKGRGWATRAEIESIAMSSPQRRFLLDRVR